MSKARELGDLGDGLTVGAAIDLTKALNINSNNVLDDSDIGVSVQAYDADTAKLDVAQTYSATQTMGAALRETKVAVAASEIDLATGNYFTKTISGATTLL